MRDNDFRPGQIGILAHLASAGPDQTIPETTVRSAPKAAASRGSEVPGPDQSPPDAHSTGVGAGPILYDPTLYLLAAQLDAIEDLRKATDNRLRQATRSTADKDGHLRGLGLPTTNPAVKRTATMLDALETVEHQVVLELQRAMRKHPLGAWQKSTRGVGEKQLARLLAAIGDPYWHTLNDRPRTPSELWAYCGLHTLPVDHDGLDTHTASVYGANAPVGHGPNGNQLLLAGRNQLAARHSGPLDTQGSPVWVAARRQRGQRANWSTTAKSRAYLIAEAMLKTGNRDRYDIRRQATTERVHTTACIQCGTKGRPASPGTPWSPGHQHADALRLVAKKDVLLELWRAARDIHAKGAA